MNDEFDDFLRSALAPRDREPDRAFVARVQARILLDEAFQAQRRGLIQRFGLQLLAVIAIATAFLLLSRSPQIAEFVAESPAVALVALIALFSLLIGLFTSRGASTDFRRSALRGFSKA
ncbi:MAG TPA: hypothetical protein VGE68_08750 [Sphingomicrobium sp.]